MANFQLQSEDRGAADVQNFIEVELAIRQMDDTENAFVILSQSKQAYIQCAIFDEGRFVLEMREEHPQGKFRHYRRYVGERNTLLSCFYNYYVGKLDLAGWTDVTSEMVQEPFCFPVPDEAGNHRAFAAAQIRYITDLLSDKNACVIEEMEQRLNDPAVSEKASAILEEGGDDCGGILAEIKIASWLPEGYHIQTAEIVWTRLQWEEMLSILQQSGYVSCIPKRSITNIDSFEKMLDHLMQKKNIHVNCHDVLFNAGRKRDITAWACMADSELETQGYSLCMLGEWKEQYPFAIVNRKEAKRLWQSSFSIGMRAASIREYSFFSVGSIMVTGDAEERIKLWKTTGLLYE